MESKLLSLVLFIMSAQLTNAPAQTYWQDPSKHRVQFVTVDDGVRLEVLDWEDPGSRLSY